MEDGGHAAGDVIFVLLKADRGIGVLDDELGGDSLRLGIGEQHVLYGQRHVVGAGLEVVGPYEFTEEGREVRRVLVAGPGVCERNAKRAFRSEGYVLTFLDDVRAIGGGGDLRRSGVTHGRSYGSCIGGIGVLAFSPVEVKLAAFDVGVGQACTFR